MAFLAIPSAAHAGPHSEVVSAFDAEDPFDLRIAVAYDFDARRSIIKREAAGYPGADPLAALPVVRDLVFASTTHTVTPRIELGLFTDLSFAAALPVIISRTAHLAFDRRADPCVFPGGDGTPTCVNADNSTTIADGLLPQTGFDARDPGGPGFTDPDDPTIFRSPKRYGLDQLHLGMAWAAMNQARDASKPTWKLGAEVRLAVGEVARLDRVDPDSAHGVGRGLHELRLWTSMARRLGWAEPYVAFWWQAPFAETSDSPFRAIEPAYGQIRTPAQQRAGVHFGFEAIAWEVPADNQRVSLDLSTRMESRFEGRAYTDMWEVFDYAGDAAFDGPLVLDQDPTTEGVQARDYPGVSNVENYLALAGRLGVRAELGKYVRFGVAFELERELPHVISFAEAGADLPMCTGGTTTGCETRDNDVVDPGTAEVNPLHVSRIDTVGHRYLVEGATTYTALVDASILF